MPLTLTDDQWAAAETWVVNEPRVIFTGRYDRLGSVDAAVRESLRVQLNSLIFGNALSFTVEDISMNYTENVKAMERRISDFNNSGGIVDPGTASGITKIVRKTYR